jgi:hypothetical protein
MEIYSESMQLLESPDLEAGWLEESTRTVHHEAVEGVEEKWHYERIKTNANGGGIVRKVIDVQGVAAQEAWDEEIPIFIYHPYTQEELDAIEAEKNKPTQAERIAALEEELRAAKILLGLEV